jgi:hypothetical protein
MAKKKNTRNKFTSTHSVNDKVALDHILRPGSKGLPFLVFVPHLCPFLLTPNLVLFSLMSGLILSSLRSRILSELLESG